MGLVMGEQPKIDTDFLQIWNNIVSERLQDSVGWVKLLRAAGYKAAHPNDGWVDRDNNEVYFCYPYFNVGAGVGDLVMLGHFFDKSTWRPVVLTESRVQMGMVYWKFIDAPINTKES